MAELGEDKHGGPLAEVSRGLVQLHRRYYGKGPTVARTYMLDDSVISVLHGGFTTVERTLIEDGKVDAVHNVRHAFQTSMETLFRQVVEDALDRKVIAYMSQVHHDPDLAAELFMLEPLSGPVTAEDEEG